MFYSISSNRGLVVLAAGVHTGGFPGLRSFGRIILFPSYTYEKGSGQFLLHLLQKLAIVMNFMFVNDANSYS